MSSPDGLARLLRMLADDGIEMIVVGMMGGVLQGAEVTTADIDIVPRRTPDNVEKLHALLSRLNAIHLDFANRRIPVSKAALGGSGHVLLSTDLGRIDVLCEVREGEGYDQLLPDSDGVALSPHGHAFGVLRSGDRDARARRHRGDLARCGVGDDRAADRRASGQGSAAAAADRRSRGGRDRGAAHGPRRAARGSDMPIRPATAVE